MPMLWGPPGINNLAWPGKKGAGKVDMVGS